MIGAGVWISICPPRTNRQTKKQTSVRPFLYIDIDIYRERDVDIDIEDIGSGN